MKKMIILFFVALVLVSCGEYGGNTSKGGGYKNESTGSPYELVVVCSNDVWKSEVGDTLRHFIQSPVDMLNIPEPEFSIIHKRPNGFKGIFVRHRNVMQLSIDSTIKNENSGTFYVRYNEWAAPQIVVTISAKTQEALTNLVVSKQSQIMIALEDAEQQRFVSKLTGFASPELDSTIRKAVDISLSLPKNYKIRNATAPDFVWLSYEMPISSQGVVIYTYPYEGQSLDTVTLIAMRNAYVKRIPGQLPNTHMKSSDAFAPIIDTIVIGGQEWVKLSGFWNVQNDFMGGPYRNYTTIDRVKNRIVSIDAYVYSPDGGKKQRNYVKQLDAAVKTIKL